MIDASLYRSIFCYFYVDQWRGGNVAQLGGMNNGGVCLIQKKRREEREMVKRGGSLGEEGKHWETSLVP
jgi:hypothetical protein